MKSTAMTTNNKVIMRSNLANASIDAQSGIALFTVVMILILISIMGAISLGLSNMNNRISQNAQGNRLLTQSSYLPIAHLIKPKSNSELNRYMNTFAPLGALTGSGAESNEYIFCYRPTQKVGIYEPTNYRIYVAANNGYISSGTGYCDVSKEKSFTSKRGLAAVQMSIIRPNRTIKKSSDSVDAQTDEVAVQPFEISNEGRDMSSVNGGGDIDPVLYRAYSTSVLPSMAYKDDDAAINGCLQKTAGDSAMRDCLLALDVPMNMQVQDFVYPALKVTK